MSDRELMSTRRVAARQKWFWRTFDDSFQPVFWSVRLRKLWRPPLPADASWNVGPNITEVALICLRPKEDAIGMQWRTCHACSKYPACGTASSRVHSRYRRLSRTFLGKVLG